MIVALADWLQIILVAIAVLTFWKSIHEYIKQGSSKRSEQLLQMRSRLRENPDFLNICNLLETDDIELSKY